MNPHILSITQQYIYIYTLLLSIAYSFKMQIIIDNSYKYIYIYMIHQLLTCLNKEDYFYNLLRYKTITDLEFSQ